jgi:hypothetical protein
MYADTENRVRVGLSVIYRWSSRSTPRAHKARNIVKYPHTQTQTHTGFCSPCSTPRRTTRQVSSI